MARDVKALGMGQEMIALQGTEAIAEMQNLVGRWLRDGLITQEMAQEHHRSSAVAMNRLQRLAGWL